MPELDAGQLRVMPEVRPPAGLDEMLAYLNAIPDYTAEDTYPTTRQKILTR